MPKLLLINPRSSRRSGLNLHNGGYFQPLALATIAGATPNNWEVILEDENWTPASLREDVDLVGISAFTSSIPRAYEIADAYRHRGIKTVLGGVHALARPHEASAHFDSVVLREADEVWPMVLRDAEQGYLMQVYHGGFAREFAKPNRAILDPKYRYGSVQVSRGCPMACSFCSVPVFSGNKIRRQSPQKTVEDIFSVPNRGLFFVDDNLIGYGEKDRRETLAMLHEMRVAGFSKPWMCQCSINVTTDDEILREMSEAGCRLIMIGIEAADQMGLAAVKKKLNARYEYNFDRIHANGMAVLGFFILGLETDVPQMMKDRIRTIHECGVDCWQITVLTPLPGTELFRHLHSENRLLYTDFPNDWGHYDFVDATFVPSGFYGLEHFRECLGECIESAYDESVIKEVGERTWKATGDYAATTMAVAANEKYGRIARQRLAEEREQCCAS